jgi:hypothetical protein
MNYSFTKFKELLQTKCFNIKLKVLNKVVCNDEVLKLELIKKLVGKDPVVMNIHITSDIVDYNKLNRNTKTIFVNNTVKHVSSKQSFVLNPYNTTYV